MNAEQYAETAASEWAWTTEEIASLTEHFRAAMSEARQEALREAIDVLNQYSCDYGYDLETMTAMRKLAGGAT